MHAHLVRLGPSSAGLQYLHPPPSTDLFSYQFQFLSLPKSSWAPSKALSSHPPSPLTASICNSAFISLFSFDLFMYAGAASHTDRLLKQRLRQSGVLKNKKSNPSLTNVAVKGSFLLGASMSCQFTVKAVLFIVVNAPYLSDLNTWLSASCV